MQVLLLLTTGSGFKGVEAPGEILRKRTGEPVKSAMDS